MAGQWDSIDDKLILYTVEGDSPERISERLGNVIEPARVRMRVRELLKSEDWLTVAEQEVALLRVLRKNLVKIQDFLSENGVDEAALNLTLSYTKELLARGDKRMSSTQVKLDQYNANVGRTIGHVVDLALTYMKGALRSEVDPAKWDQLVKEALLMAQTEIEKKQAVEA